MPPYSLQLSGGFHYKYMPITRKCILCGKEFKTYSKTQKYCSHKCKAQDLFVGKPLTEETKRKLSEANKGRKHTKEARENMSQAHLGKPSNAEGNKWSKKSRERLSKTLIGTKRAWKGDNAGERAMHQWVKKHKGEPKICEFCRKPAKNWANTNHHIYRRKLDDYIALCISCHRRYDIARRKEIEQTRCETK